jgi:hypothetical protein
MKNKLFNFVDYAAYINLRNRIDKKDILELHFSELGILQYVNRLDAPEPLDFFKMVIPGFNAPTFDQKLVTSEVKAHCCWIGHYRIIKEAKRLGAKNALVFEDDAEFIKSPYYSPVDLVTSALAQQKNITDWHVVYLGGLPDPHHKQAAYDLITPNLVKIYQVYGAHAVLYNSIIFDNLINDCETFSKDWPPLAADEYIDRIFRNKYIVYPMAVIQRKMNSDIVEGKREWYEWEKSYEKIMNRMNILF